MLIQLKKGGLREVIYLNTGGLKGPDPVEKVFFRDLLQMKKGCHSRGTPPYYPSTDVSPPAHPGATDGCL